MKYNNITRPQQSLVEYSQAKKDEITLKIVNIIDNSQLNYDQDLTILNSILDKYNFKTIPNTSELIGKSKQLLYQKVGRDDFPHALIDGVPFVIANFV